MILFCVVDPQVGVGGLDAEQGLDHDVVRVVDQLLHDVSSLGLVSGGGQAGGLGDGRVFGIGEVDRRRRRSPCRPACGR